MLNLGKTTSYEKETGISSDVEFRIFIKNIESKKVTELRTDRYLISLF